MDTIRTIVKNIRFEQELKSLEPEVERADEFLEGVEMVLARYPQCGHQIGDSAVWFIAGWAVDVAIYYAFDDERVTLLSICKTKPLEP